MVEIHPFIQQHRDAVFVLRTRLHSIDDTPRILEAGREAAGLIFRKAAQPGTKRRIVIKPNITTPPEVDERTGKVTPGQEGVVTSPHFVAGFIDALRAVDDTPVAVAEGTSPRAFPERGYESLLRERGVPFLNLNDTLFTETDYPTTGLNWYPINGAVFKDLPFVKPIGDPDVFHINMPKMKAHNLAVTTLAIKNTQGTVALNYFRQFCTGLYGLPNMPERVRAHFHADVAERIDALWKGHLKAGFTHWDLEGVRDEVYVQKAIDALDGARPDIHVLEGCTFRNGSGFRHGKDLLANYVVFGLNPVHVDSIGSWVMGHDPRNIGLYRVAHERGKGENDPARIATFQADTDGFKPVDFHDLERIPAAVSFHRDTASLLLF